MTRVFLVGFMGAGKSTIGPLLSVRLGWDFVDLDQDIEAFAGFPIRDIFETQGEDYFRSLEYAALVGLRQRQRCVVALVGGAFVSGRNRDLVKELGCSVFLDCPLELILTRCPMDGTRPLLQDRSMVEALYRSRLPFYLTSDLRVDVATRSPEEISDVILQHVLGHPHLKSEASPKP